MATDASAAGADDTRRAEQPTSNDRETSRMTDAGAMASSFLRSMGETLHQREGGDAGIERRRSRASRSPSRRRRSTSRHRRRRHEPEDRRREDDHRGRDRHRRRSRSNSNDSRHGRRRSRSSRRARESSRRREQVVPLHLRVATRGMWDLAPPGFENVGSLEAKASGLFPPPGQAAGSRNVASFNPSVLFEHTHREDNDRFRPSSRGEREFPSTAQRQARRLYVGNIPYGVGEDDIAQFFNDLMVRMNIAPAHELPVQNIQINVDKNYAFVEFRDAAQATMGMALDGVSFQSQKLKIRRPKDYIPPIGQPEPRPPPLAVPGVVSSTVPDSPNKVYVGGLPTYLNEEQVIELLRAFGELRAFNLVRDTTSRMSRGFAFCEYVDPALTDVACQGLNGMELGDRRIVVQRASVGARGAAAPGPSGPVQGSGPGPGPGPGYPQQHQQPPAPYSAAPVSQPPMPPTGLYAPPPLPSDAVQATPIVQLLNMVTPAELDNDEEYADIMEDVGDECNTFGKVLELRIPRQTGSEAPVAGVGKIFVRYENHSEATIALNALAGRQFMGRTVVASFVQPEDFEAQNY
ncbi:hypothetical protein GGI07_004078 [Coemansia sp. Benny D115]|nr:hypothetical protein GGI07_004078 [Coemansia sp. Benny D115]